MIFKVIVFNYVFQLRATEDPYILTNETLNILSIKLIKILNIIKIINRLTILPRLFYQWAIFLEISKLTNH